MATYVTEVLPDNLMDHPSARAWHRIKPDGFELQNIEILKRLSRKSGVYRLTGAGLHGSVVIAKRCPAPIASIERHIYETLLPRLSVPALRFYGLAPEPGGEFSWLFLGDAGACQYSVECAEHRALAGRWLGILHSGSAVANLEALLPDRSPAHYLNLLRYARTALLARIGKPVLSADETALMRTVAAECDLVEAHWDELERFSDGIPRTLVHGDFVAKNVRIQPRANGPSLLVFDWEMAGWGFPATDLARVDRCACPEIDVYQSVLRQNGTHFDVSDIRRLTAYGTLLRVVDQIFWETVMVRGTDTYRFEHRGLGGIKLCEPQLAAALRALDWSSQD